MSVKLRVLSWFIIFLLCSVSANAQVAQPWWYTLEQGKFHFRNGSYGDALIAFEDARRARIGQFTRLEQDLVQVLSMPEARRLGDSLEFIEKYISENYQTAAATSLAQLYHFVPKNSLEDSANRALRELDRLKAYPEAEYWLGETYRAEGELVLALRQYERAWEYRNLLETPGFDIEILYRIADIHRIRMNYPEMERQAKEIIEGRGPSGAIRDELWTGNPPGPQNPLRAAMARILENEGINRFLSLYRHNDTKTEKAHRLLGFFYYATSRFIPAAEHLMFAFLIQNTVLINETIRRDLDFTFSSLENLVASVKSRPELEAFMRETEYYRTVYYLSSALQATGKTRPANQLWAFLAGSADAGDWGNRARRSSAPIIERALEMP